MKSKIIVLGLVVLLAVSMFACSSPSQNSVSWEVPIDDFMKQQHITGDQIEVPAGGTLTLSLGSNPTTGFSWSEDAQIGDANVLKQTGYEFAAPDGEMVGASGKEVWTFEALKAGTTTISMEYSRPWEGGEKAEWTYKITVTVK